MIPRPLPAEPAAAWAWAAGERRCHLVAVWRDTRSLSGWSMFYVAGQPDRAYSVCGTGPAWRTVSGFVGFTGRPDPALCSLCWRLWARLMAAPGTDWSAQLQAAWPALVVRVRETAGPVRASLLAAATPLTLDGSTLTVSLPRDRPFYHERLARDEALTATVATIAAELLDTPVSLVRWSLTGAGAEATP